jgi:hypothetical protein
LGLYFSGFEGLQILVPSRKKYSREGELFTADRAGFLRELRLSCADAVALFSQTEGMYLVASEIAPALPCPVLETLISISSLMSPCRTAMRARRARAYSRYLEAVRAGIVEQVRQVAQLQARSGHWRAWAGIQLGLRGRIGCQLALLKVYGFAYRAGIHLNFQRRTAKLGRLVSLLDS